MTPYEVGIRIWAGKPNHYNLDCLEAIKYLIVELDRVRGQRDADVDLISKNYQELHHDFATTCKHYTDVMKERDQLKAENERLMAETGRERRLKCGCPSTYGFGEYCAICERNQLREKLAVAHELITTIYPQSVFAGLPASDTDDLGIKWVKKYYQSDKPLDEWTQTLRGEGE